MKKKFRALLSFLFVLVFIVQLCAVAGAAGIDGENALLSYSLTAETEDQYGNVTEVPVPGENEEALLDGTCQVMMGDERVTREVGLSIADLKDITISVPEGYYVGSLTINGVSVLDRATAKLDSADLSLKAEDLKDKDGLLDGDVFNAEANKLAIGLKLIDDEAPVAVWDGQAVGQTPEGPAAPAHHSFVGWRLTYANGSSLMVDAGTGLSGIYADCELSPVYREKVYNATLTADSKEINAGDALDLTATLSSEDLPGMQVSGYTVTVQKDGQAVDTAALEAGEYELAVSDGSFTDENGTAVKCNVNYVSGKLTVKAAAPAAIKLTVKANDPVLNEAGEYETNGVTVEPADALKEGEEVRAELELVKDSDNNLIHVVINSAKIVAVADGNETEVSGYNITTVPSDPIEMTQPSPSPAPETELTITANEPKLNGDKYETNGFTVKPALKEGETAEVELKLVEDTDKDQVYVEIVNKDSIKIMKDGAEVTGYKVVAANDSKRVDLPVVTPDPIKLIIKAKLPVLGADGKTYNANGYDLTEGALAEGDEIKRVEYTVEQKDGKWYSIPTACEIVNKDGDTVAAGKYDVSFLSSDGVEPVAPTPTPDRGDLTIKANDVKAEYSGSEIKASEVTATGLVEGDKVESVEFEGGSVNVTSGVSSTPKNVKIVDANGTDVTGEYSIKYEAGTVIVTKKTVTLTGISGSLDPKKDSSGNYVEIYAKDCSTQSGSFKNGYKVEGLLSGHQLSGVTVNGSGKEPGTEFKTSVDASKAKIADASKNDVTANYEFKTVDGKLKINEDGSKPNATAITITADSQSWVYDGKAHTANTYKISSGSLASGDKLEVTFKSSSSITNVGSTSNVIEKVLVKNSSGQDVTANYKITKVDGKLTVTKFDITLTAVSDSKDYDGKALNNMNVSATKLANTDHKISVTLQITDAKGNKIQGGPVNVGTYTKKIDKYTIKDGETDVTANYNVKLVDGTLTVKSSDKNNSDSPKTGDESNIGLWIGLLAGSAVIVLAIVAVVVVKNKKKGGKPPKAPKPPKSTDPTDGEPK